jgi:hypothetical protein
MSWDETEALGCEHVVWIIQVRAFQEKEGKTEGKKGSKVRAARVSLRCVQRAGIVH